MIGRHMTSTMTWTRRDDPDDATTANLVLT